MTMVYENKPEALTLKDEVRPFPIWPTHPQILVSLFFGKYFETV